MNHMHIVYMMGNLTIEAFEKVKKWSWEQGQ